MRYNRKVEELRDTEYPYLRGKTYLDHGGTTLYARSLVDVFSADLLENLYGNPHSASTPSALAGHRIDAIRERALRFFGADPQHFDLIFVSNATAAMKLVMECFADYAACDERLRKQGFWYGYHKDAHNSLVGIRELSNSHRCFGSDAEVEKWITSNPTTGRRCKLGLFAYPGQSNMTGRRLPLSWAGKVREASSLRNIYTLFDAAALATTSPLYLSDPATAPDFTCVSFYKIFGFPNVGALIVRKDSGHVLQRRRYFGGGTVDLVTALDSSLHYKRQTSLHDQLEDGTLPFHSIFALDAAMSIHAKLYTSMKTISEHTAYLGKYMFEKLSRLRWSNGRPILAIYCDSPTAYGDASVQGATIAFNVYTRSGNLIPPSEVEKMADRDRIYIRSGGLCNPGGMAGYLGYTTARLQKAHEAGQRCGQAWSLSNNDMSGVARVSLGAMSIRADVDNLVTFFVERFQKREAEAIFEIYNDVQARGQKREYASSLPSLRRLVDHSSRRSIFKLQSMLWVRNQSRNTSSSQVA